jgi:hypothetical protein
VRREPKAADSGGSCRCVCVCSSGRAFAAARTSSLAAGALRIVRRGSRIQSSESESKLTGEGFSVDDSGGRRAGTTGRVGDTPEGTNLYRAAVGEDFDWVLMWLWQKRLLIEWTEGKEFER